MGIKTKTDNKTNQMASAKKSWGDMTKTEKDGVLANLKALYDSEPLASKVEVEFSGEYVHNLSQGSVDNNTSVSASGSIGSENADKVDGLKDKFTEALSSVNGAKVEITARYGIGDKV